MTKVHQPISISWQQQETIKTLASILNNGSIAITTTDTVPGLLCRASKDGFDQLCRLKKDRGSKPFLVLAENLQKAQELVCPEQKTHAFLNLIAQAWPGPVTLVCKAAPTLPPYLQSTNQTIAIRVPKHNGLARLLEQIPFLFSTSANISGMPTPTDIVAIDPQISHNIACIVYDEQNQLTAQTAHPIASTIIDVSTPNKAPHIIREGAYPITELESLYGCSFSR